jgi:HEPN domain-containing protein
MRVPVAIHASGRPSLGIQDEHDYVGASQKQPMPNPDFPSAASRHLLDAKLLMTASPANSLYLAGYVAECSLKAVVALPGLHAPAFGHQLTRLRDDGLDLAIAMAPGLSRYRPASTLVDQVRVRWSENRRYDTSTDVTEAQAKEMVKLADEIFRACVVEMFLDGVLQELPR